MHYVCSCEIIFFCNLHDCSIVVLWSFFTSTRFMTLETASDLSTVIRPSNESSLVCQIFEMSSNLAICLQKFFFLS